jgi:hypothetical protein
VVPMFRSALWSPTLPIKCVKLSVKNFSNVWRDNLNKFLCQGYDAHEVIN